MSSIIDLHLHTTASDGRLTPPQMVRLAAQRGLRTIAITDHDSISGVEAALAEAKLYENLEVISGVEMSASVGKDEVHMLGYFLNIYDPNLVAILQDFQRDRSERGREMVDKLNDLGMQLEWQRVEELAQGGTITRPHIAQAMIEKGYISTIQEAFDHYIGETGPANVSRERLSGTDSIALIIRSGGLPVLAHPARYVPELEAKLPSLVSAGLVGMEVYYKDYTEEEIDYLSQLCGQYTLVPCGGSDYHGMGSDDEVEPGRVGPPIDSLRALESLLH